MKWKDGVQTVDLYDSRIRSWFIEASTCSKDMVILVDNSGSMTGMGKTIAKATVASIMETLSNNDFVAVLNFSKAAEHVVPCFSDILVQATPENLDKFKSAISEMKPDGQANVTEAFTQAFSLLQRYRDQRNCNDSSPCNQVIMLVTDSIANNITEVMVLDVA